MVVEEDYENSTIWITTDKRDKRIKVYIPMYSRYSHWHIKYEDGTNIVGLDGVYLTGREAVRAVEYWEVETKESKKVYLDRVLGPESLPVLKRKKVKRSDAIVRTKAS
jgi:hypothetical protein